MTRHREELPFTASMCRGCLLDVVALLVVCLVFIWPWTVGLWVIAMSLGLVHT